MVRVAVYLPGMTASWSLVDFLLDTGAATTCLHPPDTVERLAISNQRLQSRDAWESVETYHGVGGGATYFVARSRYALLDEHGEWQIIEGTLRVAEATVTNRGLASILGWDILRGFAVTLDWQQRLVELR